MKAVFYMIGVSHLLVCQKREQKSLLHDSIKIKKVICPLKKGGLHKNPPKLTITMLEEIESERLNNTIPLPAYHYIDTEYLMDQRIDFLSEKIILTHFLHEGRLKDDQIQLILKRANEVLSSEPNLLKIESSAFVIGDIHGQFFDLYELMKKFDLKKDVLVFLGDYVDRGVFSLEVFIYLLVLKVTYPDNIFLLRGNHECKSLTTYFTFQEEVKFKHNSNIYDEIVQSFCKLPLAAVILDKAFCVHGGISPHLKYVDEINKIDRFREIPYDGLMCDLMWADPAANFGLDNPKKKFEFNSKRNVSYVYYFSAVKEFLENNDLDTIIRGHEVEKNGYKSFKCYRENIPSVYTVFSAPNYCDVYNNLGSVLFYNGKNFEIHNYDWVDHPYVNKNYIDVISQTFSFVSEKVSEFYMDLLKYLEELASTSSNTSYTLESTISEKDLNLISSVFDENDLRDEIERIMDFNKNMILMREERENSDEIELDNETLSTKECKAVEDVHTSYSNVHEKDSANEEKVDERINDKASSVLIPPSMVSKISKQIQEMGLEKAIESCDIKVEKEKLDVKIKKD